MYRAYYAQLNIRTGEFTEGDHCSGLDGEYTEFSDDCIWSETLESRERARELLREKIQEMLNLFDNASQKIYW